MSFKPHKQPGEQEYFAFDFELSLDDDETIESATWTVAVVQGTDPSPSAMLSGSPIVDGSKVSQMIIGGLSDVQYRLSCQAVTNLGQTLELYDTLWVRTGP